MAGQGDSERVYATSTISPLILSVSASDLQVVWEQLNGALYDLEDGDPDDAIPAVEDCIKRIEALIRPR